VARRPDAGPTNASRVDFFYDFPPDDPLLARPPSRFAQWKSDRNSASDDSGQIEQTSYMIFNEIGIHYNYALRARFHQRRPAQQQRGPDLCDGRRAVPDGDEIKEWYPNDPNGRFYKIEDWFEFAMTASAFTTTTPRSSVQYDLQWCHHQEAGALPAFLRPRALSQLQSANDYSNFLAVVEAASPASNPASTTIPDVAALIRD